MGKVLDWADVQGVDLEAQRLSSTLPKVGGKKMVGARARAGVCCDVWFGVVGYFVVVAAVFWLGLVHVVRRRDSAGVRCLYPFRPPFCLVSSGVGLEDCAPRLSLSCSRIECIPRTEVSSNCLAGLALLGAFWLK